MVNLRRYQHPTQALAFLALANAIIPLEYLFAKLAPGRVISARCSALAVIPSNCFVLMLIAIAIAITGQDIATLLATGLIRALGHRL